MFLRYTVENDLTRKINVKVKEADSFIYSDRTYELCGFTVHSGESANSGHYRAYRVSGEVYDDHGGAADPTLRKVSPERLEQLKENGYLYLYKKKSRPSESGPEAVPSEPRIEDSGEPMDLSTPSKSPESGGPLDLSTPSKKSTLSSSPGPLSSDVDRRKSSSASSTIHGDVNLNDWRIRPVLSTPSKALKRTTPSQSPLASVVSPMSQSFDSQSKKPRISLPSPGKRYLQQHPDVSQDGESPQLETVKELAEMVAFGEVTHEPSKVSKRFPLI